MNLPDTPYTQRDLDRARTKGKMIGWLQGAVVGAAGVLLVSFSGWIPVILGVGLAGYVGFKLLTRRSAKNG